MPTTLLREKRFPTGMVLFGPLPGADDFYVMWLGRGGRLLLAHQPYNPNGTLISIEHPTADGDYYTLDEARLAANAFANAPEGF